MARFRYTINELEKPEKMEYLSDLRMLRALVAERMGDCTNVHAPLYRRLQRLGKKLDAAIESGRTDIEVG